MQHLDTIRKNESAAANPTGVRSSAGFADSRLEPIIAKMSSRSAYDSPTTSDVRSEGSITPKASSRAPSGRADPLSARKVRQMVAESKFHDGTLCQLLDAARLNLIGTEAKKALNLAAKARVNELGQLQNQGEVLDSVPSQ